MIYKYIFLIIFGFSSGIVISAAIFAFIATIGIVPRLAQRTKTKRFITLYEEMIILGGIFGCLTLMVNFHLPIGNFFAAFFSLCVGIFYGCLAICLTEILDVLPIVYMRFKLKTGITMFVCALAIGKMVGSLLYFFIPGFYFF